MASFVLTGAEVEARVEVARRMMDLWDAAFPGPCHPFDLMTRTDIQFVSVNGPDAPVPDEVRAWARNGGAARIVAAIIADPRGIWIRGGFGSVWFDGDFAGNNVTLKVRVALLPTMEDGASIPALSIMYDYFK